MNLLEQYIVEVHSVEPCQEDWMEKYPNLKFLKVDVTTNCYGSKKRETRLFSTEEWEKAKEKGYWMA